MWQKIIEKKDKLRQRNTIIFFMFEVFGLGGISPTFLPRSLLHIVILRWLPQTILLRDPRGVSVGRITDRRVVIKKGVKIFVSESG